MIFVLKLKLLNVERQHSTTNKREDIGVVGGVVDRRCVDRHVLFDFRVILFFFS